MPTVVELSFDSISNDPILPGGVKVSDLEAVRAPRESARVLPPRCYVDPEFHAFEVEKVMMRNWLLAGRLDQIEKPGDYFTFTRFDEPVVVLRDQEGAVRAFSAVCRHRAFPIVTGSGNCGKKGFNCPYHGWRYRTDGTLAAAPFMQDGFDPKKERLPEFGVDIWQGFIFINFDNNAELLSPKLKTLDKALAPFGMNKMKSSTMREKSWPGNWKATLDNFTEAYHQPFVHPTTFEPWAPARLGIYDDVDGPYNLFWLPAPRGEIHLIFDEIAGLPEMQRTSFIVVNVFPMFHLLIDPSCVVLLDMAPHACDALTARWDVLVSEEEFNKPGFEERRDALTEALVPTWIEDEDACNRVRCGQISRFAEQGAFSWMEKSVHQFHKWLADQYLS